MRASMISMYVVVVLVAVYGATFEPLQKVAYENCGPPIEKVVIHPNPPRLRQVVNITIAYVAAHSMVAGTIELFINVWPYHVRAAYCDDGKSFDGKGCLVKKGERRVFSQSMWIDDNFQEIEYHGNGTVTNSFNEVMACIRTSFKIYDD